MLFAIVFGVFGYLMGCQLDELLSVECCPPPTVIIKEIEEPEETKPKKQKKLKVDEVVVEDLDEDNE